MAADAALELEELDVDVDVMEVLVSSLVTSVGEVVNSPRVILTLMVVVAVLYSGAGESSC